MDLSTLRTLFCFAPEGCTEHHPDGDADGEPDADVSGQHAEHRAQSRSYRDS